MSLTHSNKITKTGSTLCGTIYNDSTILLCDSSSNLRSFSFNTQAEVGSPVAIGNSASHGIAIVNGACALITSNSVSTVNLVELSTGYRQSYSATYSIDGNNSKTNVIAYDPTTNTALWIVTTGGAGILQKINLSTYTVSSITSTYLQNFSQTPWAILYYKPGRFLVFCNNGLIVEIDSSFTIYNQMWLHSKNDGNTRNGIPADSTSNSGTNIHLFAASIVGDLVTVHSRSKIHQIAWESQQIVYEMPGVRNEFQFPTPVYMSNQASGITVLASPASPVTLYEYDTSVVPMKLRDMYIGYAGSTTALGINASGQGYYANSGTDLVFFNVATRSYTSITPYFQDPSGQGVPGEIILYNKTDNVLHTHTVIPVGGVSIQLPTGKTWRQLGIIYSGVDQKFEESEFTI